MSTIRAASTESPGATQGQGRTAHDRRPLVPKVAPASALGVAAHRREALGAGGVMALQAAAGNRAVSTLVQAKRSSAIRPMPGSGSVVQRTITLVDGTIFNNAGQIPAVIQRITHDGGVWESALGGTLPKLLKPGTTYGPFANGLELLAELKRIRGGGERANAVGEAREKQVATLSGGRVADTGKYGQDKVVHLNGSDRHVKLDIESDTEYGIVGGPAKASNLQKFAAICRDLQVIAQQDHKLPRVYCTHDTPEIVALTAKGIVGAQNVINLNSKAPWDFHKAHRTAATAAVGGIGLGAAAYYGLSGATALGLGLVGAPLWAGVGLAAGVGALAGYAYGTRKFTEKPKQS